MKTLLCSISLMLVGIAGAAPDKNPSDYPLAAHLVSAVFTHTTAPSNKRTTEMRIGNLIYVTDDICKWAEVGKDYPARLDGKKIHLLIGQEKVCSYRVVGTREAQP